MKISVILATRRYGGLVRQIKELNTQSIGYSEFELIIVDGLYWQRKEEIANLSVGFSIKHIPPNVPKHNFPNDSASMRNAGLTHAAGKLVVFIDDYEIPSRDFLLEHWRTYETGNMTRGAVYGFEAADFDTITRENMPFGEFGADCVSCGNADGALLGNFSTNNCSAPLEEILAVNGFDEKFGYEPKFCFEDYDLGHRMILNGNTLIYNKKAICYHMDHKHIQAYPPYPLSCEHIFSAGCEAEFLELYPTIPREQLDKIDWDNLYRYYTMWNREIPSNPEYTIGTDQLCVVPKIPNHDITRIYAEEITPLRVERRDRLLIGTCDVCGVELSVELKPLYIRIHRELGSEIVAPKQYYDLAEERRRLCEPQ